MKKDGLYYLLSNGIEFESYTEYHLVYWNYSEMKPIKSNENDEDSLGIYVYKYSGDVYFIIVENIVSGKEISVFVDKDNKIHGLGSRSEKTLILNIIKWYKNGDLEGHVY